MPVNTPATGIFSRAWQLLTRNWIIVVPSVVIGFLTNFLVQVLAGPGDTNFSDLNGGGPAMFAYYITSIVIFGIEIFGSVLSIAFTTGMAGAAWTKGTARVSDGVAAFRRRPLSAIGAILLLLVLGAVAGALVIPTFFISIAAFAIFFIYTMSSVLIGGRSPTEAIVESCSIAAANLRTTILVVLLIFGVAVVAGILAHLAGAIPFAGPLLEAVLTYAAVAYGTLVVVGEYLQLRRA